MSVHYRACNLCEAICGLVVEVDNGRVISIKGDENDPFSKGHICPKAVGLKDIYEDEDRLKSPIVKRGDVWEKIGWDEALDLAAEKLLYIKEKYGNDAIAIYQGNPSVHNFGTLMNSSAFVKAVGTRNNYSATSTDQLPHHLASWLMFGHPGLLPVPDVDRCKQFIIIGGNPAVSNGSMMTAPNIVQKMRDIQNGGGNVIVIDPIKTETAKRADKHIFIKPASDMWLLGSLIRIILDKGRSAKIPAYYKNEELLKKAMGVFDLKTASQETGIEESVIVDLAEAIINTPNTCVYGRMGVSVQENGSLCLWMIYVLNAITGNMDHEGGLMFTKPAVDFMANAKPSNKRGRWTSRVSGKPEFIGELPVSVLAEEMTVEGEGKIRAFVTSCGNPVLSNPNGGLLEKAIEKLAFRISIDIYMNETSVLADLILPPATGLEVSHYDLTFNVLAIRNTAKYSSPTIPKAENQRYDWEIFQELTHRLLKLEGKCKPMPPEMGLNMMLGKGAYDLSVVKLMAAPHGVDLGPLLPCLPERLVNEDKMVDLAPQLYLDALKNLRGKATNGGFALISKREQRSNNSWMHNASSLIKGRNRCMLMVNTADAADLKLTDEENVRIMNEVGELVVPIKISDDIMKGVVSLPHGYGHHRKGTQIKLASAHGGKSINDITNQLLVDSISGNAAFSNNRVVLEKILV